MNEQNFSLNPGVSTFRKASPHQTVKVPRMEVKNMQAIRTVLPPSVLPAGTMHVRPSSQPGTVQLGLSATHIPSVIHQTSQPRGTIITGLKPTTNPNILGLRFGQLVPTNQTPLNDVTRASLQSVAIPTNSTIQITLQHQRDLSSKPRIAQHVTTFTSPSSIKSSAKLVVPQSVNSAAATELNKPITDISCVTVKPVNTPTLGPVRPMVSSMTLTTATCNIPIAKVTHQGPIALMPQIAINNPNPAVTLAGSLPPPGGQVTDLVRSDLVTVTQAIPASGVIIPQPRRTITRPVVSSYAMATSPVAIKDHRGLSVWAQPSHGVEIVPPPQSHIITQQINSGVYKQTAHLVPQRQPGMAHSNALTRFPVLVSVEQNRPSPSHQAVDTSVPLSGSDKYGIYVSAPQTISTNPSSSPRPSIIRKRTINEGSARKQLNMFSASSITESPCSSRPDTASLSNSNSPKASALLESRDSSQSSTDTALSNDTSPNSSTIGDVKVKQEPVDPSIDNAINVPLLTGGVCEMSPRKKPRKQLLKANEELKDHRSSEEEDKVIPNVDVKPQPVAPPNIKVEIKEDYVDNEGIRWTVEKKRSVYTLLGHYGCNWKTRSNHFTRHADIKVSEERRPTVNELSNQNKVGQRTSGWKFYHLCAQIEDLFDVENDVSDRISNIQKLLSSGSQSSDGSSYDLHCVEDVAKGTMQRSHLVHDQLSEAKTSLLKILEHKVKVMEIINKHISKRPIKKKERT